MHPQDPQRHEEHQGAKKTPGVRQTARCTRSVLGHVNLLAPLCLELSVKRLGATPQGDLGFSSGTFGPGPARLAVVASVVLLLYLSTLGLLADIARTESLTDDANALPTSSPVLHSGAALAVQLFLRSTCDLHHPVTVP